MIRKLIPTVLFLLTVAASGSAQTSTYSFDNFDTQTGVKLYLPAAPARSPLDKLHTGRAKSTQTNVASSSPSTTVRPTILTFDSTNTVSLSSSLRGFTTGNEQVDGYVT